LDLDKIKARLAIVNRFATFNVITETCGIQNWIFNTTSLCNYVKSCKHYSYMGWKECFSVL